jgi:drug/metabolite transporter (DMT)-like permease
MRSLKGYGSILCATLFWGISATFAKFLFSRSPSAGIGQIDTLILVQMRMTLSCIVLVAIFVIFRPNLLKVKAKDLYKFALLGILGAAGSNFMYYFTIQQTNVATAILLQYLAPLLVLVYAAISKEEVVGLVKIAAGAVSLGGCFLAVAGKDFSILNINRFGLLAGLCAALCWAFTNVWLRHLLKTYNVWTALVYSFIFASLFWMVINPPWKIIAAGYPAETWGLFFGFAMISILIPHSFYFGGIRFLTASRAIITATFEPIVAIVSAYIILGESLVPVQILGAVLVLAAIAILQIKQERPAEIDPSLSGNDRVGP